MRIKSSDFSLSSLELVVYLMMLSSSLIARSSMLMFLVILCWSLPLRCVRFFLLGERSQDLNLEKPPLVLWLRVVDGVGFVYFLREGGWSTMRLGTSLTVLRLELFKVFFSWFELAINLYFFFSLLGDGLTEVSCDRWETGYLFFKGI